MEVHLEDISKHYRISGDYITALDSLNFHAEEGAFVAVVGKSGSGKTTILNLIAGLDRPSSGGVMVGGKDYSRLSDEELSDFRKERIGYVFQAFYLELELTALENVWAPLIFGSASKAEMRRLALEALKKVGLEKKANFQVSTLSYGQRQRVAIARALITKPSLLLADEPTGNLDRETGESIMKLLEDLNAQEGITLIMVTHDFDTIKTAGKIYVLENGKGRFSNSNSMNTK